MKKILSLVIALAMVFSVFATFSSEVFAAGKKEIDIIEIEDVLTPRTGWYMDKRYTVKTDGVYVANVQWEPEDENFKPLSKYEIIISLEVKPRYVLSNTVKAYINGQEAVVLSKGEDNIKISYVFPNTEQYDVPSVKYYRNGSDKQSIYLKVGERAELKAVAATSVDYNILKYQWYYNNTNLRGTATPIVGANTEKYTVVATEAGDKYYFCDVSYEVDGKNVTSFYKDMGAIRVSVNDSSKFYIEPKTDIDYECYDSEEDFALEVTPVNANANEVTYAWYRCSSSGIVLDENILGNGQALLIYGMDEKTMEEKFYYKCVAKYGKEEDELVFSCTLNLPDISKYEIYDDVLSHTWYFNDVYKASKLNLINGKSPTRFDPDGNLTYAEAIKLAACINQLYNNDEVTLKNGNPWYQTYVDYARKNGIPCDYKDYNAKITREEFVHIFYAALPKDDYKKLNKVASIPDIATCPYANEILEFYRAGILTGKDSVGTFYPKDNIKRSEVATIVWRMMDFDSRMLFSLDYTDY